MKFSSAFLWMRVPFWRAAILATTLFLVVAGAATGARAEPPERFREVRNFMVEGIGKELAPSVAVAVVQSNRVVWSDAVGRAEVESGRPATPDSIYILA